MGALREKLSFFSTMNTMVFCAAIAALFAAQVVFSAPANTALSEALELIQTTDPKKPPPKAAPTHRDQQAPTSRGTHPEAARPPPSPSPSRAQSRAILWSPQFRLST